MTFIKTKGGGFQETGFKEISIDFNRDNLIRLLTELINDNCPYTHQDVANWVRNYHLFCIAESDKGNAMSAMEDILCDMDAQWDVYLFNTYITTAHNRNSSFLIFRP